MIRNEYREKGHDTAKYRVWLVVAVICGAIGLFIWSESVSIHSSMQGLYKTYVQKPYSDDYVKKNLDNELCSRFDPLRSEIEKIRKGIWKEWNVTHYPYFLKLMHVPHSSWRIQKLKFLSILAKSMKGKDATKNETFVIGFSGSSVTAGHDNYFSEAYPNVAYEKLLPLFKFLNYSLVVRNHAIGNNPCYAYDACIATHLGDDLDIATWEQSMNCGRDPKPLDTFTRQVQYMKKKPSVVYFLSGGPFWNGETCKGLNITKENEDHRPPLTKEENSLLSASLSMTTQTNNLLESMEYLNDHENKEFIPKRFERFAPMGQSVFPIQDYRCYGPYNVSFASKSLGGGANWHPGKKGHQLRGDNFVYTLLTMMLEALEDLEKISCSQYHMNRKRRKLLRQKPLSSSASFFSVPQMKKHSEKVSQRKQRQLSSFTTDEDILESYLLQCDHVLGLSLTTIEKDEIEYKFHKQLAHSSSPLFPPHLSLLSFTKLSFLDFMIGEYLHVKYFSNPLTPVPTNYKLPETNYPSNCYTDFEPRIMNSLTEIIQGDTRKIDDPHGTHNHHSQQDQQQPQQQLTIPPSSVSSLTWTRDLSWFDKNAIVKAEKKNLGYLDRKYIYLSNGNQSVITFKIHTSTENVVWLCELQKGFGKYPPTMEDLDRGALVQVHSTDSKATAKPLTLKLELLSDQCYRSTNKVPAGEHLLTIQPIGDKQVNIAYVVTWS